MLLINQQMHSIITNNIILKLAILKKKIILKYLLFFCFID